MPNYRVLAEMPWDSGLPEDVTINTWYFNAAADADLAGVFDELATFYAGVDAWLSSILAGGTDGLILTAYDLADAEPREPVRTDGFVLTLGSGQPLPTEVACVVSYHAAFESGVNKARRRGRVYLGPLDVGIQSGISSFIAPGPQDGIRDAAQALLDASDAAANWAWMQYSSTEAFARVVTGGWVDNSFDTQRRRGIRATSRLLFS